VISRIIILIIITIIMYYLLLEDSDGTKKCTILYILYICYN